VLARELTSEPRRPRDTKATVAERPQRDRASSSIGPGSAFFRAPGAVRLPGPGRVVALRLLQSARSHSRFARGGARRQRSARPLLAHEGSGPSVPAHSCRCSSWLSDKATSSSTCCAFDIESRFWGEPFRPRGTRSGRLSRSHEVSQNGRCAIRRTGLVCPTATVPTGSDVDVDRARVHGRIGPRAGARPPRLLHLRERQPRADAGGEKRTSRNHLSRTYPLTSRRRSASRERVPAGRILRTCSRRQRRSGVLFPARSARLVGAGSV
jgi:hypothetical protein